MDPPELAGRPGRRRGMVEDWRVENAVGRSALVAAEPHRDALDLVDSEALDFADQETASLIDAQLSLLGRTDPYLARAVELCALPRVLDPDTVGAVTATSRAVRSVALIKQMRQFGLLERGPGQNDLRFHQLLRESLLRRWLMPARAEEYATHQRELVTVYRGRVDDALVLRRHLSDLSQVIRRAKSARYVQLRLAVERELLSAVDAALYHAGEASPTTLAGLLRELSEQLTTDERLGDLAVNAVARFLRDSDGGGGGARSRLEATDHTLLYWYAYVVGSLPEGQRRAADLLRALLERPSLEH